MKDKQKYGIVSNVVSAVDMAITGYKIARQIQQVATMFDKTCIDDIIKNAGKHKFEAHTLDAIEKVLALKYGPALKFAKEESETTAEFDAMSEEEVEALGLEIVKQMLDKWKDSEDYKKLDEEIGKDEKAKFFNPNHSKEDGKFTKKNGGAGSKKDKGKKSSEETPKETKTETKETKTETRHDGETKTEIHRETLSTTKEKAEETHRTVKQVWDDATELPRNVIKKVTKAASWTAAEAYNGLTLNYGAKGAMYTVAAGLAAGLATGVFTVGGGASVLAAGPLLVLAGLVADVPVSYLQRRAARKAKESEAEDIKNKAKDLAKQILERKKENEEREKVGQLAEEIATRLNGNDTESDVGKKVEKDVKEKVLDELVKKVDKKPEGKGPVPEEIKELRKDIQNKNISASRQLLEDLRKAEAAKKAQKARDESRDDREQKREARKEERDQKKSTAKKTEAQEKTKKDEETRDKRRQQDKEDRERRREEQGKTGRIGPGKRKPGSGPNEPPEPTGNPVPTPKTPPGGSSSGGIPVENLKDIQGIGGTGTKVKPNPVSPVTSKNVADWIKNQTGKSVSPATSADIDKVVKEGVKAQVNIPPEKPPEKPQTDRGDVKSAPPGSKLVGLFPESGKGGEESYVRGRLPEKGYEGHGPGRPKIVNPPKPGLPIMPTPQPKTEAPKSAETPPKPAEEPPQAPKPASQGELPLEQPKLKPAPNAALEDYKRKLQSKPKKKPKSIDQIIADANKKIDEDKSRHSMEEVLKKIDSVLTKYSCEAMPMGSNTFVPAINSKKRKLKFENPEGYETLENVCIFDEHHGEEEGLDIDFNEEMLQKIIDRCNDRIEDTGDHPVIIDGHTEEDEEESKRDVLGFASNFQMGMIGNKKPRKCIYCDMHIRKEHVERAKALPRRSIELWHKDLTADPIVLDRAPIDNIALLGDVRPARDLGLLFSKEKIEKVKYRYSIRQQTIKEFVSDFYEDWLIRHS